MQQQEKNLPIGYWLQQASHLLSSKILSRLVKVIKKFVSNLQSTEYCIIRLVYIYLCNIFPSLYH